MAASVAVKTKTNVGAKKRVVAEVTLDASYATGGYEIKPSQLGLRVIDDAQCSFKALSAVEATTVGGASYNPATKKLTVQSYKTQAEIANATSLAGVVVLLEAWGR